MLPEHAHAPVRRASGGKPGASETTRSALTSLLNAIQDAFFEVDLNRKIVRCNSAVQQIFGYSQEELIHCNAKMLFASQEDFENFSSESLVQRFSSGPMTDHIRYRKKDGTVFLGEVTASLAYNEEGKPHCLVAIVRDTSSQKGIQALLKSQEETALRQQNALLNLARHPALNSEKLDTALQTITESASEALEVERTSIWFFQNANSKIECANLFERTPCRHTSKQLLTAAQFPSYFRSMEENRVIAADDAHNDPRTSEFSKTYLTPLKISSMLDAPIRSGGRTIGVICHEQVGPSRHWTLQEQTFAGSMADLITLAIERAGLKRAEEELRESEKRYRTLMNEKLQETEEQFRATFEQAAVGIAHVRTNGRFGRVNKKLCEILGYSPIELIEKTFEDITYPEDLAMSMDRFSKVRSGSVDTTTFEKRYVRKDGSTVWVNLTGSPVKGLDGKPKYFISVIEDISERKRIEHALRESEEQARATFDQAAVGISHVDLHGNLKQANKKFCTLLGYTHAEVIEKDVAFITHPEDLEATKVYLRKLFSGETSGFTTEKRYLRKDGSPFWANLYVSTVLDSLGKPKYFIAVIEDISERKKAEEGLKLYREIFAKSADGIGLIDLQGRYLEQNQAHKDLLGYENQDLLGKTPAVHFGTKAFQKMADELGKKGRYRGELISTAKNGDKVNIDLSAFAVENEKGEPTCFVGIKRDITERKNVEHQLRLLASITSMSVDAISAGNEKGQFIFWNKAAEKIFGYTEEEVLGKNIKEVLIPPGKEKEIDKVLRLDPKGPEAIVRMRTERLHKDGHSVPVMVTSFPIVDESGEYRGRAGYHQDLTEYAKMERKLLDQSRMAAVGTLASAIAHELRNPLFGISSIAQILANETSENPSVRELADSMLSEINRLNRLLENLLLYARPRRLEISTIDVKSLCEEILERNKVYLTSKKVKADLVVQPARLKIRGDGSQIRQVLLNLILNAAQASPTGGTIRIQTSLKWKVWTFEITNGGPEIEEDLRTKIFEPFFSTKKEGTGLGLAVCKKIVEEHGGVIRCESEKSDGTRFIVEVPQREGSLTTPSNPV